MPHIVRAALILASWWFNAFAMAADINGRWLTFDSASGDKRSIVEITHKNDHFSGRIVELFLKPDESRDPVCDLCSGAQRGQKIRGMEILFLDSATNGTGYTGKVLDPEEGRYYKCIVTLDDGGKHLSIRGYVGIPLLGRNEAWERVE